LEERLYTFIMVEGTSVQKHLNDFNSIIVDLESSNVKIEDLDKAILLSLLKNRVFPADFSDGFFCLSERLTDCRRNIEKGEAGDGFSDGI